MGKNSLVIFDVDGTLVNSNSGVVHSLKDMFLHIFSLDISVKELLIKQNESIESIILYFTKIDNPELILKARQFYKQVYSEKYFKDISLFPNVKDSLEQIYKNNYTSTATNLSSQHVELIFSKLGIIEYFDYCRGTNQGDRPKPNPDIIIDSVTRFAVEKNRSIIIGDSLNDIAAGKNAGIYTVLIDHYQRYHEHESQQADFFISDISQLHGILKEVF
jgi:HAD superfamily hydrolase (TIGR01509 family)